MISWVAEHYLNIAFDQYSRKIKDEPVWGFP